MLYDTTWSENRVDSKYGVKYCFDLWFREWFDGELVPSARGGFETAEAGENRAISTCKECGALVLHGSGPHSEDVVHLNAHRSWHDKINDLLDQ